MAALLFLLLAFLLGDRLRRLLFPDTQRIFDAIAGPGSRSLPPAWTFELPASLVLGTLTLTWATYLAACAFAALLPLSVQPLLPADLLVLALTAAFVAFFFLRSLLRGQSRPPSPQRLSTFLFRRPSFYFVSLLVFVAIGWFVMASVFYVKGGILYAGETVFSDFAPHTALIRSFSVGRNFPTEYPFFSGEGIRYHFLFLFLTGNLEFLGLRIDHAFNLLGALGLVAFCLLLGSLAVLLVRRRAAFFVAPLLLFLQSSLAILPYLARLWNESHGNLGGVLVGLLVTHRFIGDTPNEIWGIWTVNVYSNQRHLLWGFAALLLVLFLLLPLWARAKRPWLLSRAAWIPDDFRPAVAAALILCMLPFFHGSVLVAAFLILSALAVFSSGRLAFAVALVPAFLSALLQARLFSGGASAVASPTLYLGFISVDKSLPGILTYALYAFGFAFVLLVVLPLLIPRRQAVLWFAFLTPFLFAFTVSLTPDILVNHKFILLSFALENIFIAGLLLRLASPPPNARRFLKVSSLALAGVLTVGLTATGLVGVWTYFVANRFAVGIDLSSPSTTWIEKNTSPEDVFLTPPYSYDAFFLSGRKSFMGWPYYAWSAGYDTVGRFEEIKWLYAGAGGDPVAFRAFCASHGIRYAIIDDSLRNDSSYVVNEAFFDRNFPLAATFPSSGNLKIYRIPESS